MASERVRAEADPFSASGNSTNGRPVALSSSMKPETKPSSWAAWRCALVALLGSQGAVNAHTVGRAGVVTAFGREAAHASNRSGVRSASLRRNETGRIRAEKKKSGRREELSDPIMYLAPRRSG